MSRSRANGVPDSRRLQIWGAWGRAGYGDWPQTRTQALGVFPEPHLKFGHDAVKTNLCRSKACGNAQQCPWPAQMCLPDAKSRWDGHAALPAEVPTSHMVRPGFTSSYFYHRQLGGSEPTCVGRDGGGGGQGQQGVLGRVRKRRRNAGDHMAARPSVQSRCRQG